MAEMLLLSNSTAPGRAFLEHALEAIAEVLDGRRSLLFVALAASDPQLMRRCLAEIGVRVDGADAAADPRQAIAGAEACSSGAVTASGC